MASALAIALALGYGTALLRGLSAVRTLLERLTVRSDPEQTVLGRTVMKMSDPEALVTVRFKDGARLAGTPRHHTQEASADERELFLQYTRWWNPDKREWGPKRVGGGVLVRLAEVEAIEMDTDPQGSLTKTMRTEPNGSDESD